MKPLLMHGGARPSKMGDDNQSFDFQPNKGVPRGNFMTQA